MSTRLERLGSCASAPARTISYGQDPDQVYDVREPRRPREVTVLLIHGGFWRPAYDRAHTAAMADSLAGNGFHVAVVEYRRAARGGWNQMREDLVSATRSIRHEADLPDPLLTMGHSAGGHLALWLQHHPVADGLLGTVALAPCADLRRTYDLNLGDGAAQALMGSAPDEAPSEWLAADPARCGQPPAPVRIVHGRADTIVPLEVSRAYVDHVGSAHVSLDTVAGAGHYDVIDPESAAWGRVVEATSAGPPSPTTLTT
ncbi:alpha/beta hydrolase family protein [Demetria terragena]|uniref:alpha/beta hydrolase family protein n=1 Tax=Demetria terragena TaxID=63959 RepID=UPI00039BD307|nr:alpha/beta hydrolase [Demetria terragena]